MSCEITKNGLFDENGKKSKHGAEFLSRICVIDEDVVLLDILKIIKSYSLLNGFVSMYSSCNFNSFYNETKKPLKKAEKGQYLEIFRSGSLRDGVLDEFTGFHLIDTNEKCAACNDPKYPYHIHSYGLDFSPLPDIVTLPVKINKRFFVFGNNKVVFDIKKEFTLLDVLDAILFEISFYGDPIKRNKISKEIKNSVAEFDLKNAR